MPRKANVARCGKFDGSRRSDSTRAGSWWKRWIDPPSISANPTPKLSRSAGSRRRTVSRAVRFMYTRLKARSAAKTFARRLSNIAMRDELDRSGEPPRRDGRAGAVVSGAFMTWGGLYFLHWVCRYRVRGWSDQG